MKNKINSFEDLIIWQKAQDLAFKLYKITNENIHIRKDFALKNQIKSAAISISDNIAEGFEYNNNPDFKRFLRIAKGSCGEIRNKILFLKRMEYINQILADELSNESKILGNQIGELIKKVNQRIISDGKISKAPVTHNT